MLRTTLLALLVLAALPLAAAQSEAGECVDDVQIHADQDAMRVTLSWDPVAGATSYHVHRQVDGDGYVHLATTADTTFVDEDVPGAVLDYVVAADGHAHDGCSAASVHMHGPGPGPGMPDCPDSSAHALADGGVRLTWTHVAADDFHIERATGDGGFLFLASVSAGSAHEYVDATTEPGVAYRYRVLPELHGSTNVECMAAHVTAVPFVAPALALALGLGAYAAVRRRT